MKKSEKIAGAILTIVIGILLVVMQNNFIGFLMTLIGGCLIVFGALDFFHHFIPPAVIKVVSGTLIIVCGWVLVEAVLYLASAMLLIFGILLLYDKLKKGIVCDSWLFTLLEYAAPVFCIAIGALFLFHQAFAIELVFIIAGIFTTLEGAAQLINALSDDL